MLEQGDLALLKDPVAESLLQSRELARLAYTWRDGSPRVVPIWFYWNGEEVVLGTPPRAPKLKVLQDRPQVALSIDSDTFPYRALQIRGIARLEKLDSISPEYQASATRYFGEEGGRAWLEQVRRTPGGMTRIRVKPEWVAIIDFETRFPSAMS
ncbi:MAG: pyridoxamine 5'-phosphate oxidase family protein [Candidatus Dormibacteraeota bacterium]|nr:pyridoxamine 5'-phosphate oxidase family protein [Candidatus Dormibacteraeota bacterium]